MGISAYGVIRSTYSHVLRNAVPLAGALWPFAFFAAVMAQAPGVDAVPWIAWLAILAAAILATMFCSAKAASIVLAGLQNDSDYALAHTVRLNSAEMRLFKKYFSFCLIILCCSIVGFILLLAVLLPTYVLLREGWNYTHQAWLQAVVPPLVLLPLIFRFVRWSFLLPPVVLLEDGGLEESETLVRGNFWPIALIVVAAYLPIHVLSDVLLLVPVPQGAVLLVNVAADTLVTLATFAFGYTASWYTFRQIRREVEVESVVDV